MPNEIYHRSNWGESKAEDFGDVYYDHAATNKLYNHSDYYENSDGTDATLKDLNNKASIVLTPTAYSDGSLNTVIPPYGPSYILNLPYVTSEWSFSQGWSIDETNSKIVAEATWTGINVGCTYGGLGNVGKTVRVSFDAVVTAGTFHMYRPFSSGNISESGSYSFTGIANGGILRFRNRSTDFAGEISNVKYEVIDEADFDFSRGSSATRVNEQGLVQDVQILSGELVQNGNFEQIGSELVTNGNFGTDSDWIKETGWSISDGKANKTSSVASNFAQLNTGVFTNNNMYKITFTISNSNDGRLLIYIGGNSVTIDITNATNGTHTFYAKADGQDYLIFRNATSGFQGSIDNVSVKEVGQNWTFGTGWSMGDGIAQADNTSSFFSQSGLIEATKLYRLTFQARLKSGTNGTINAYIGGANNKQFTIADTNWQSFTYEDTRGSSTANSIYFNNNGTELELDNVSVVEVTNDTDLPRIDFTDGTGSLLLEPQRTNTFVYSEDYSQSNWIKNQITATANSIVSPDGSLNASLITISSSTPYLGQSQSLTSSTNYTMSAFVKKGTNRWVRLAYVSSSANAAWFDLENNVVGTQSSYSTSASIENYGNGWYRITNTFSSHLSSGNAFLGLSDADNSTSASSSIGNTVYVWGLQVTQGDYPTSYIPTSDSTVTRSADVANNSGNADLFNDSEGVLYVEIAALADTLTSRVISISNGSSNERLQIAYQNSFSNRIKAFISSGGSNTGLQYDASDITDFIKVALKYKSGDYALWVDGIEVNTNTSAFTPTGLSELAFDSGGGSNDFYGKTKSVAVFKEALSNDLLERLTGEGYESFRLLAEANNYTII